MTSRCRLASSALLLCLALVSPSSLRAQEDDIGNPEKAIKRFSEAVKKAPEDSESWYNLAFAYFKAGKFDDAASTISKAAELNPQSVATHQLAGAIAEKRNKPSDALAAWAKARDIETAGGAAASLRTLNGLAAAHFDLGKWDDAIDAYKQAWKVASQQKSGDLTAIHNQLGAAYLKKGDTKEAIRWFEKNVEAAPDSPATHYNLGMTYRKLAAGGQSDLWTKAADSFKRSADLSPGDAIAQFFAGEALMIAGRNAEALPYLDKYLAGDPDGKKAVAKFGATGKSEVHDAAREYKALAAK